MIAKRWIVDEQLVISLDIFIVNKENNRENHEENDKHLHI